MLCAPESGLAHSLVLPYDEPARADFGGEVTFPLDSTDCTAPFFVALR